MLKKTLLALPVILIVIVGSLYFLVNREARAQADQLIAQVMKNGSYQALSYESLAVNLIARDITLHNLKVIDLNQFEYILQEIIISDFDLQHELPQHLNLSIQGLSFPNGLPAIETTNNTAFDQYLNSLLSEKNIPLMMNYHYQYKPSESELIETTMTIGLNKAANFSFSATIKNIPLEALVNSSQLSPEQAQAQLLPYLANAEIPSIKFSLEDLGLIEAMMTIQAETAGTSPEEQHLQAKTQVQNLYLLAPQPIQQLAMSLSMEMANFIDGGQTLSMTIEPEYDGNIQSLQPEVLGAIFSGNYSMILDLLNFEMRSQAN